MASGNSGGSIHESSSSGGGDEEYDSRTQSNIYPSFFNRNPPIFPHNPTSYYNPHAVPSPQNLDLYPQSTTPNNFQYNNNINISDGMIWPAGLSLTQSRQASPQAPAPFSSQPDSTKNPKKRTRASRRAPTTVLTTDTTNFRQMVQEFTGIPAAPFPGSPYPRQINLLSAASALRPGDGIGPLYSLRPPHNIVPQQFSSSSPAIFNATMIDAIVTSSYKTSTAAVPSDQAGMLNRQQHVHNSIPHRFEAGGSIDFGNYISDFRFQEIASSAAAGDHLKASDDGIQEKFMPFDETI